MKRIFLAAIISAGLVAPIANAEVTDAYIAELREQLALMSQRLDQLEAENASLR